MKLIVPLSLIYEQGKLQYTLAYGLAARSGTHIVSIDIAKKLLPMGVEELFVVPADIFWEYPFERLIEWLQIVKRASASNVRISVILDDWRFAYPDVLLRWRDSALCYQALRAKAPTADEADIFQAITLLDEVVEILLRSQIIMPAFSKIRVNEWWPYIAWSTVQKAITGNVNIAVVDPTPWLSAPKRGQTMAQRLQHPMIVVPVLGRTMREKMKAIFQHVPPTIDVYIPHTNEASILALYQHAIGAMGHVYPVEIRGWWRNRYWLATMSGVINIDDGGFEWPDEARVTLDMLIELIEQNHVDELENILRAQTRELTCKTYGSCLESN